MESSFRGLTMFVFNFGVESLEQGVLQCFPCIACKISAYPNDATSKARTRLAIFDFSLIVDQSECLVYYFFALN